MTSKDLKTMIHESLVEELTSEGVFDTLKHVGKDIASRVSIAAQKGYKDEFDRIQNSIVSDLTKSYENAVIIGKKAKMSPQDIDAAYINTLNGILKKVGGNVSPTKKPKKQQSPIPKSSQAVVTNPNQTIVTNKNPQSVNVKKPAPKTTTAPAQYVAPKPNAPVSTKQKSTSKTKSQTQADIDADRERLMAGNVDEKVLEYKNYF